MDDLARPAHLAVDHVARHVPIPDEVGVEASLLEDVQLGGDLEDPGEPLGLSLQEVSLQVALEVDEQQPQAVHLVDGLALDLPVLEADEQQPQAWRSVDGLALDLPVLEADEQQPQAWRSVDGLALDLPVLEADEQQPQAWRSVDGLALDLPVLEEDEQQPQAWRSVDGLALDLPVLEEDEQQPQAWRSVDDLALDLPVLEEDEQQPQAWRSVDDLVLDLPVLEEDGQPPSWAGQLAIACRHLVDEAQQAEGVGARQPQDWKLGDGPAVASPALVLAVPPYPVETVPSEEAAPRPSQR